MEEERLDGQEKAVEMMGGILLKIVRRYQRKNK